jgi:hypothetical protein
MLLLTALLAPAIAAPTGDPVPLVEEGRLIVGARLSSETLWEQDLGCDEIDVASQDCDGAWKRGGYVATGRVVIADGLALDGELGWLNDTMRQASFEGAGMVAAIGLRGSIPVGQSGWWLSGVGRLEGGVGKSEGSSGYEESAYRLGTMTGLLAWRDTNISVWGGGQGAWMWDHRVEQRAAVTDADYLYQILLTEGFPASGVLGIEVISDPMGPGWTPDWRLSVGFEGSLGQSQAAHFWAAFRY